SKLLAIKKKRDQPGNTNHPDS
ncbi:MAG: hypothetical protein RL215_3419, partial [Planctomycetota bacterium]